MQQQTYQTGRLYYLPIRQSAGNVGLNLSGTNATRSQGQTQSANEDMQIVGGTTDLVSSRMTLKDASEAQSLSNADIPITQIFGKRALVNNFFDFTPPLILREGNSLIADVLVAGAESNGNLIFVGDPINAPKQQVTLPANAYPFMLALSAGLTGAPSERVPVSTPVNKTKWTLVLGAGTDLSNASIRIDDAENQPWMLDFVPIWAVCGYPAGQIIQQTWFRPYLIPPGGRLRVEFQNAAAGAESNGFIYFKCARW